MLTNQSTCEMVAFLSILPFDEIGFNEFYHDKTQIDFQAKTCEVLNHPDLNITYVILLMAAIICIESFLRRISANNRSRYRHSRANIYQQLEPLIANDKLSQTKGISHNLHDFLASIEKSPLRIKNLSDEQRILLEDTHEDLLCSISGSLKDMPVLVYGEPYDFSSVLAFEIDNEEGRRIHPKTRELFYLIEVQADRPTREIIQNLLSKAAHTYYPAFFAKRGVRAKNATWSKIAKTVDSEFNHAKTSDERNKVVIALKQFSDYAKKHDRKNLYEKSIATLDLLKPRINPKIG